MAAVNAKPPIFTMYPDTTVFANAAVKILDKEKYGKTYASVLDVTCPSAISFDQSFEKISSAKGFKKSFSIDFSGDEPNVVPLLEKLKSNPVDFINLPNNSKFSGFIISKVQKAFPKIKFFGTHGWGDQNYGFIAKYGIDDTTEGFAIRQGRELKKMTAAWGINSLDYEWKEKMVEPGFAAFEAIHFIRKVSDDLCKWKPADKSEFATKMSQLPKDYFGTGEPLSVYKLVYGKLQFGYEIK